MFKLQVSVLSIILFILISCSAEQKNLDADVLINKYYKYSNYSRIVYVKYQVENTGELPINGWNLYIRVSMKSGNQVVAFDGLTYHLEQNEKSDELIATGTLPDHFKLEDLPINAAVKFIEVY